MHLYNWGGYFTGGLLEEFENAYDCEIVYDVFESNEELYETLKSGTIGYDIVFPSSYFVPTLVAEGLLQKLNTENMPNLANLDPHTWLGLPLIRNWSTAFHL